MRFSDIQMIDRLKAPEDSPVSFEPVISPRTPRLPAEKDLISEPEALPEMTKYKKQDAKDKPPAPTILNNPKKQAVDSFIQKQKVRNAFSQVIAKVVLPKFLQADKQCKQLAFHTLHVHHRRLAKLGD